MPDSDSLQRVVQGKAPGGAGGWLAAGRRRRAQAAPRTVSLSQQRPARRGAGGVGHATAAARARGGATFTSWLSPVATPARPCGPRRGRRGRRGAMFRNRRGLPAPADR